MMNDLDLWNECQDSDQCEVILEFCRLVDALVKDIRHLEAQCIRARFELSNHLPEDLADALRQDILSDLRHGYQDYEAYEMYKNITYAGGDPFDFRDWLDFVRDLRNGIDDHRY